MSGLASFLGSGSVSSSSSVFSTATGCAGRLVAVLEVPEEDDEDDDDAACLGAADAAGGGALAGLALSNRGLIVCFDAA